MKKLFFFFVFIISCALAPNISLAQTLETIRQMNVVVDAAKDGNLSVSETIVYDFGSQQRHGLLRIIPENTAPGGSGPISLENIQVLNEAGIPYPFTHTGSEIRVGDPEVTITGVHTYIVNYTVKTAVGFFRNYNEIYWNAVGTEWRVPIEEATIVLKLPIPSNREPYSCYRGKYKEKGTCSKATVTSDGQNTIYTFSEKNLGNHEGVTIAATFLKGALLLKEPPEITYFIRALVHYGLQFGYYSLPFIVVLLMSLKRIKYEIRKRSFAENNALVPEYDANPYSPLEAAAIWKENIVNKDFSAEIIQLAVLGHIIIEEKDKSNYIFNRTDKASESLSPAQSLLLYAIENRSTKSLADNFYKKKEKIIASVENNIIDVNPLVKKTSNISTSQMASATPTREGLTFAFIFIYFWLSFFSLDYLTSTFVILLIIRYFALPAKKYNCTPEGFLAQRKLDGLYYYINVAEKDRILFHDAPEKSPEIFEKLLPYAMIFGLEKKWAKEFEDIYRTPPDWYSSTSGDMFSTTLFASNLGSFSSATASMARPSTSSSFGSSSGGSGGFSSGGMGGGFSGGGGGGGGGGSW